MKTPQLLFSVTLLFLLLQNSYALEIESKLTRLFGNKPLVVEDYDEQLKKIIVNNSEIYFASHDGQYLFAGPIIDTELRTNIVSVHERQVRIAYLKALPEDSFVNYPSRRPRKYTITVFTDIDCPYCRKFHSDMPTLNKLGVSVNYVMMPRTGIDSPSYKKTVSALCANSPSESITKAMRNEEPKNNNCNPKVMKQHLDIARDLKISNTPTIVLPDGQLKIGLVSPQQLLALLQRVE